MSKSEVFGALLEYAINTNVLSSIVSSREISAVPVVGYINDSGVTVLPADMYDEEIDGIYDDLFPRR